MTSGDPADLVIRGRRFLPRVEVSYGDSSASVVDLHFLAELGGAPLSGVTYVSTTELHARLEAALAPGPQALIVRTPTGASAALADAVTVGARGADHLAFDTSPWTAFPGRCAGPIGIAALDSTGAPGALPQPVAIELQVQPAGALQLFADPGCQAAIAQVELAAAAPRAELFFVAAWAGEALVRAASPLGSAEQVQQIAAEPPSAFAWDPISTQTTGVAFAVRAVALGAAGAPVDFTGTGALAAPGGMALSCLAGCDASGAAWFQGGIFRGQVALEAVRGVRLTIASGSAAGTSLPFDVLYPPPASVAFATSGQAIAAGACSGEVRLELHDAAGQPVLANSDLPVAVASAPAAALGFFSDGACAVPLTALQVPVGASGASLYFSGQAAGAPALTAQVADLPPASQAQAIAPGPTAAFEWAPISAQTAGAAFPVRAVARDAYGNATGWTGPAALSASAAGLTCSSGCGAGGAAQLVGGAFDGVLALSSAAAAVTLTLAAAGVSSTSAPFDVAAPPATAPAALAFGSGEQAVIAGLCSPPVLLQLRDSTGQVVAAPAPIPVALAQSPAAAVALYADAACTAPLVSPAFTSGASELTFYFSGRTAGEVDLSATSAPLAPAVEKERIDAGPASRFVFDPLPSSVRRGVDLAVTVRAQDQLGNLATSFGSTATLSLSPAAGLLCAIGCSGPLATASFSEGTWSGWVRVGAPAGAGRVLAIASGPATGSSSAFAVVDQTRTPPRARISASASWVRAGGSVTLDASGSSDPETGSDLLEASWDTAGAAAPPGTAPWTSWSQAKTLAVTLAAPGLQRLRLAVRDADGDLGYATADVLVVAASTPVCTLTDPGSADDGITSCDDPDVSLTEAIRISNASAGARELIVVPPGFAATVAAKLTVTSGVDVVGGPGSQLRRVEWVFQGGDSLFSSVELVGEKTFNVAPAASLRFAGARLSGFDRLAVSGGATFEDSRFDGCAADPCLQISAGAKDVRVLRTTFESAGRDAIYVFDCVSGVRELVGDVFRNLDKAVHVKAGCGSGPVKIAHGTFDGINQAMVIESGTGHVFANNVITGLAMAVISKCDASFSLRGFNVEWNDAVSDCTRTDANTVYADPQLLDPLAGDYRLRAQSPARDSAADLGFDLAPALPTRFAGLAPDRGALETW